MFSGHTTINEGNEHESETSVADWADNFGDTRDTAVDETMPAAEPRGPSVDSLLEELSGLLEGVETKFYDFINKASDLVTTAYTDLTPTEREQLKAIAAGAGFTYTSLTYLANIVREGRDEIKLARRRAFAADPRIVVLGEEGEEDDTSIQRLPISETPGPRGHHS